ncbi:MAG: hypothetical protein LBB50_04760, partial [Oscillospiraceae bacterium]|nr:hypothetical protein [Oscillospiraceae bacterium]
RWSGYNPNIGSGAWSQDTVRQNMPVYSRVFFLYALCDIVPHLFNTVPYLMYDLEGKKKEEMYIALNERRALIANGTGPSDEMVSLVEAIAEEEA